MRVIGIGQPSAGDDAAGIAVARALREERLPACVEIYELTDITRLIELLDGIPRAILIDAVVADAVPGNLLCLTPEELAARRVTPLSSHGASVAQVLELARTLAPATTAATISLVAITIDPPARYTLHMSQAVTAALPRAVTLVRRLLDG